jgi:hypothetical protein
VGEESNRVKPYPIKQAYQQDQKSKETQSEQNQQNREGVKAELDESKEERQIAVKLGNQNNAAGNSIRFLFIACRMLC